MSKVQQQYASRYCSQEPRNEVARSRCPACVLAIVALVAADQIGASQESRIVVVRITGSRDQFGGRSLTDKENMLQRVQCGYSGVKRALGSYVEQEAPLRDRRRVKLDLAVQSNFLWRQLGARALELRGHATVTTWLL